jgi:elongation factor P
MLTHTDLKKGVKIVIDGQPYEVLESSPMKVAQRRPVVQTRIKNILTGNVSERNFQQGEVFEEADIEKFEAKFLYSHRDRYFFSDVSNPKKRFDLTKNQIGKAVRFLKANQVVEALIFEGKVINIYLPIKIQLKVIEAPPGIKGDRAQGGTKTVTLETGAQINVPLFIESGDTIEINTETGEYSRRVE